MRYIDKSKENDFAKNKKFISILIIFTTQEFNLFC